MKYNLPDATWSLEFEPYYIRFDAVNFCSFDLRDDGLYLIVNGPDPLGEIKLHLWDIAYGEWDKEHVLPYLMTHHILDLGLFGIGYHMDAEAVELPDNFVEAE